VNLQTIVLVAGQGFLHDTETRYPVSFTEFGGKPLIELNIQDLSKLEKTKSH
jgi:hypothetical protein